MQADRFSQTAISAACYRAFHARYDDPKIFDDPLAYEMVGEQGFKSFQEQMVGGFKSAAPDFAASFPDEIAILGFMMQAMAAPVLTLSRASYEEEGLEEAVRQGIDQYVILGAGLDSFAWRRPDLMERLQVFEVDHPATQSFKLQRLAELGWPHPPGLHFVPIDFNTEDLGDAIRSSAFDPDRPAVFSWMGVTYYLPRPALLNTLQSIARIAAPGSQVVFDYLEPDAFNPAKASQRVNVLLMMAQGVGENMQMGFDPFTIGKDLAATGWNLVEDFGPFDIEALFFIDRPDDYYACEHAHLVKAARGYKVYPKNFPDSLVKNRPGNK